MSQHNIFYRYTQAKKEALQIAALLQFINPKGAQAMIECGQQITLALCPTCGMVHVQAARTCKHRLCPQCQLRRARKIAANMQKVVNAIDAQTPETSYTALHVTLTQRNVGRGMLKQEISEILEAISRLRQIREFRNNAVGWVRKIEVTFNKKKRSWHPHIHLLVLAKPGSDLANYEWWVEQWAKLLNLNYRPQVAAKVVEDRTSAIYEVSKYVTKPAIFSDITDQAEAVELLAELLEATEHKQLIGFGGLIAKVRKQLADKNQLQPENAEDEETIETGCKHTELQKAIMEWHGAEYIVREIIH